MAQKIKVGAVSYLNTKPLLYGFEQGMLQDEIELSFDYPANVARQLLNDEIDVGLVPVAVLPLMKEYHIISDYCIGATGPVASVCLFSDVPMEEITEVLLDYQSRTSVALLKVLIKNHWKTAPVLTPAVKDFEQGIGGTVAGLVIGDRAFVQRKRSKYVYDLAEAWQQMTGLPFVFAVWVSGKKLPDDFTAKFNTATGYGLNYLPAVESNISYNDFDIHAYFTKNISYPLSQSKREGLAAFLRFLQ